MCYYLVTFYAITYYTVIKSALSFTLLLFRKQKINYLPKTSPSYNYSTTDSIADERVNGSNNPTNPDITNKHLIS